MSDLSDDVSRLKKRMQERAFENEKAEAGSFTGRRRHELTALHKFLFQVTQAGHWIYRNILAPVGRMLARPARWLWRMYRLLWDKVVYVEDHYQNRIFSKTRAGLLLTASLVFAWYVLMPVLGLVFDSALYLVTVKKDEVLYLTNSQEILPHENVHSVQGCHTLPCTDANSVYFRIRPSLFNEAWSLTHGRGLFFPDYVAASVPLTLSRCTITSYGVRIKLFMRSTEVYPDLLQTECTPVQRDDATK